MRKGLFLSLCASLLFALYVPATAQTPPPPPKVIQIVREEIKTGRMPAHTVEANNVVQIWQKAKSPYHRIAMIPVAGNENEVMYVWPFDSYAEVEKSVRDLDQISTVTYKADFDRIAQANGGEDNHVSQRDSLAILREDLSYRPNADISKMRFVRVQTVRVKPGANDSWVEARKIMKAAHEKANIDESILVYQVVGGMQDGTYMVFIPWKSLDGLGTLPHPKEYWDAMGSDNRTKMDKLDGDSVAYQDVMVYALAPQLSYVSSSMIAADPGFWTFKPLAAPATTLAATKNENK